MIATTYEAVSDEYIRGENRQAVSVAIDHLVQQISESHIYIGKNKEYSMPFRASAELVCEDGRKRLFDFRCTLSRNNYNDRDKILIDLKIYADKYTPTAKHAADRTYEIFLQKEEDGTNLCLSNVHSFHPLEGVGVAKALMVLGEGLKRSVVDRIANNYGLGVVRSRIVDTSYRREGWTSDVVAGMEEYRPAGYNGEYPMYESIYDTGIERE